MNPQANFNPNDPQTPDSGFCQQCGIPLTEGSRRSVAGAVYCEPCLAARIGATFPAAPAQPPLPPWPAGVAYPSNSPNPRLAALLGFIPGVGAMYNEQYAKGVAHLTIFALLVVLSDANGIFGLFIAGWEFYMAIEAYHTAIARRDGTVLPNPFGLNELGDRLGLSRAWTAPGRAPGAQAPYTAPGAPNPQPYASDPNAAVAYPNAAVAYPEATQEVSPWSPPFGAAAPEELNAIPPYRPSAIPFAPAEPIRPATPGSPLSRFPSGAVWLILLGVLFLLSTTGLFRRFSGEALLGWSLIGLAGWLLLRHIRERSLYSRSLLRNGTRGLDSIAWLLTSGILALLDGANLLSWGRSWPVLIIVAGVLALLGRAVPPQAPLPAAPPAASVGSGPEQTR